MEKKEAYGSIPLTGFQNTNTLEGKIKLAENNAELYVRDFYIEFL